jgi:hypothetical protein
MQVGIPRGRPQKAGVDPDFGAGSIAVQTSSCIGWCFPGRLSVFLVENLEYLIGLIERGNQIGQSNGDSLIKAGQVVKR